MITEFFSNRIVIMSLTNKDNILTSVVFWNQYLNVFDNEFFPGFSSIIKKK